MPGELGDVTQFYPYRYERRYEPGTNPFPDMPPDIEERIQSISERCFKRKLSPQQIEKIEDKLADKGYLHRNFGDEDFENEVRKSIKMLISAIHIVRKYARFK